MLKRASSNGMFILTKTLAHQKRRQERCESKRSVKQANEKDHLLQTVSESVSGVSL